MSPRPGPARPLVAFRIRSTGLAEIDRLAKAEGVTRSEMIRQLLAEAVQARATNAPTLAAVFERMLTDDTPPEPHRYLDLDDDEPPCESTLLIDGRVDLSANEADVVRRMLRRD